jgi:hypothetical protein
VNLFGNNLREIKIKKNLRKRERRLSEGGA